MAPAISRTPDRDEGREEKVQVVEEGLTVGKREVATGGVRVTSRVVETPVEQTVRLREERVEARRRPDDRRLSPEEADAAFAGRTVEMMGTGEEAEVGRTARVVEQVSVRKRAGPSARKAPPGRRRGPGTRDPTARQEWGGAP